MKKLKHVVFKDGRAVLFGDDTQHNQVGNKDNVRSAGFCHIDFERNESRYLVTCFGESISLEIKSDPDGDAKVISYMVNEY